jgi:AraC-like DNA-binding protein
VAATTGGRHAHRNTFKRLIREAQACETWAQVKCPVGMVHVVVPVRVGRRPIANLLLRHLFLTPPNEREFARLRSRLIRWGLRRDLPRFRQAYLGSAAVPEDRFRAGVELATLIARRLEDLATCGTTAPAQEEVPCVRHAKEFIQTHFAEPLTVPIIATGVGLCREHFCRQFKKSTGLTVLEYATHVRVEHAKALLRDRDRRIGEIAMASGFNSIPYFNRAFRKLTGQSPTAYRRALV